MAIQGDKIMNLEDGQVLYNDLRRRIEKNAGVIEEVINTPSAVQTFDDGADNLPMALEVAVDPVQDLHGYDNPWPMGGGKNIISNGWEDITHNGVQYTRNEDGSVTAVGTASPSASVFKLMYSDEYPVGEYYLSGGQSDSLTVVLRETNSSGSAVKTNKSGETYFSVSEPTYYGVVIRVPNGASVNTKVYPMIRRADTQPGWEPYKNICPISGWTGANVMRTGKNLFDKSTVTTPGFLNANGTIATNVTAWSLSDYIDIGNNSNIAVSGITGAASSAGCGWYDSNKQFLSSVSCNTVISDKVLTVPTGAKYFRFSMITETDLDTAQVEIGSSATTYEPFVGSDTYHITFPSSAGTVYGGELTINKDGSGTLVVDKASIDLGTINWGLSSSNDAFLSSVAPSGIKIPPTQTYASPSICSDYKASPITGQPDYTFAIAPSGKVKIYDSRFNLDTTAFKTAMNGVELVYPLATPTTYTLTVPQVKTLLGVNNIWADTGNILSVDYPADTKLYIDKKFAELSAAITALGT